ncbi:STAS/SEC14 domain-containing protein [Sphingosinicella sp. CPCC 101087]|uniref:STAS/SEC14 domain-containing protein n=1 Tax=Sphingosinicella sp. CPCC 101087 TaxID=2497754 RepID=UPI00101C3972|nr:STAS/SEC14 domain-containing protein [Sphingosinicella sp. CPCC 101087]
MLEYLPSTPAVIAVRCGGSLTRPEIEGFMDRLEAALAQHERTHFFVEIVDFGGLEMEGLGDLMKRSATWFRNLDRVGRVAVVADQGWIRWAAKLESALLPHVAYETFEPAERDRAWAWVQGELKHPHAPALKVIDTDRPDALAFEIDGHIDRTEMEAITAHFLRAAEGLDKVRMLGRIRRLGGLDSSGLVSGDFFAMKRSFLEHLDRYAIVGGPVWIRTTLYALAPLLRVEIRHFEAEDEAAAWAWIGAKPVSERPMFD